MIAIDILLTYSKLIAANSCRSLWQSHRALIMIKVVHSHMGGKEACKIGIGLPTDEQLDGNTDLRGGGIRGEVVCICVLFSR